MTTTEHAAVVVVTVEPDATDADIEVAADRFIAAMLARAEAVSPTE